eukprot:365981-Chlamydomonas_euryale.AAC.8
MVSNSPRPPAHSQHMWGTSCCLPLFETCWPGSEWHGTVRHSTAYLATNCSKSAMQVWLS